MVSNVLLQLSLIGCFGFILCSPGWPVSGTVSGDVTGDGIVDGRDALKIERIAQGLETATQSEIERGDVYPIPGLNGRRMGDGKLTREDAELILQQSVDLLPEGTFSGDYSDSAPAIRNFFPPSGAVGTTVTLEGVNFLGERSEENLVYVGGVLAPIRAISGTRIVTEVPSGAQTGRIAVWTPGGKAESSADYYVTQTAKGQLNLSGGLKPSDFTIVSAHGESPVNADGSFSTNIPPGAFTLLGAVTSSEINNSYFAMILPTSDSSQPPLVIDALTTAKSLVFMHPFLMTYDENAVRKLSAIMDALPEIKTLAEVIARRYPAGADGLEDEEVLKAWEPAVTAVLKSLPQNWVWTVGNQATNNQTTQTARIDSTQIQRTPIAGVPLSSLEISPLAEGEPNPVKIYNVDQDYLRVEYEPEGRYVRMKLFGDYSPLDWIVGLYPVNPESMPMGLNTPFSEIRSNGLDYLDEGKTTLVAANQWTLRIDLVGTLINWGMGFIPTKTFSLPSNEEGVYIVRACSGALRDYQGWDQRAITLSEHGQDLALTAYLDNLTVSVLDLWAAFAGIGNEQFLMQKLVTKTLLASAVASVREYYKEIAAGDEATLFRVLTKSLLAVTAGLYAAAQATVEKEITPATGKSGKLSKLFATFQSTFAKGLALSEALRVISCVGKVGERMAGMMGYLINPLEMELSPGPTPLETFLIVVGDPFGPVITSFSPQRGGEESIVTLTGKRFASTLTDNHVLFGDREAEILSGDATRLVVKVPTGVLEWNEETEVPISMQTPASIRRSASPDPFTIIRTPSIREISPIKGYTPNPTGSEPYYPSFIGTTISAFGSNLIPLKNAPEYELFFGDFKIPIDQAMDTSILFKVPKNAIAGDYGISLRDPLTGIQTSPLKFHVIGTPSIQEITPQSAQSGQLVEMIGENLTGATLYGNGTKLDSIVYQTDFMIQFIFPSSFDEEKELKVLVVNPAGKSEEKTIQRLAGVQVPSLSTLSPGYALTICTGKMGTDRDGKLSLDEITQFLSHQLDLTQWDDENEKFVEVWTEVENLDGSRTMKKFSEFEDTPAQKNNGTTGHETRETWRRDRHLDGTVYEYKIDTIDLDATEDELEEADCLAFSGSDPALYNPRSFKNTIYCQVNGIVDSSGFSLTPQTDLNIPSNALGVEGSISLADGCQLTLGKVTMKGSLEIKANNAVIHSGTFYSAGSDAIRIVNGYGNTIGNPDRIAVWLLDNGGDGIVVEGGGKNSFSGIIRNCRGVGIRSKSTEQNTYEKTTIQNCAQGGLYSQTAARNTYRYVTIQNCAEGGFYSKDEKSFMVDGVHIQGGKYGAFLDNSYGGTITYDSIIEDCQGTGLTIQGGSLNAIGSYVRGMPLTIRSCQQMGVWLAKTESNLLRDLQIEGCGGNALQLGPDASSNTLNSISASGSQNGLVLTGDGTQSNRLESINAGFYQDIQTSNWVYQGNRGVGIMIQDGANNNTLFRVFSMANQGHGILLEGAKTHTNRIEGDDDLGCDNGVGCIPKMSRTTISTIHGNGGDGVVIQNGAHHNTIHSTFIVANRGNGVTIQGESTDENTVEECTTGSGNLKTYPNPLATLNGGFGIAVQNKANGTILVDNILGANFLGGVLIDTSRPASEDQDASTLLSLNNSFSSYTAISDVDILRSDSAYSMQERAIVHVRNSSRVEITKNNFADGTYGIVVDGENSGQHYIAKNWIVGTSECIHIENSVDDALVENYAYQGEGDGYVFVQTKNTQLMKAYADYCKGNAMVIDRCTDVTVSDSSLTYGGKFGVLITGSENVTMQRSDILDMAGINVSLFQSKNLTLDRVDMNGGAGGILAEECDGVAILGHILIPNDPDALDKSISFTEGPGITIRNSQNVSVGSPNFYVRLVANEGPGILIQGEETKNVDIAACLIFENAQEGIRVEGGKEIALGGSQAQDANYIYDNEMDGILAQGENSEVRILNNWIGLTEEGNANANLQNGVTLQGGIHHASITGNIVLNNQQNGIRITGGAHHNQIGFNTIANNTLNGIFVEGAVSRYNQITRNSITQNNQMGIRLTGGNNNVEAPPVSVLADQINNLIGHIDAPDASIVEIFADSNDEGESLIATASVLDGNFIASAQIPPGKIIRATVTHPDGNTSEFGSYRTTSQTSQETQMFVFSDDSRGQKDIFIKRPTSNAPERLTDDLTVEEEPQVSSQGRYIVYTSSRTGNKDVWVMSSEGANPAQVTNHAAADYSPAWQPGSDRVLFVSERDGNPEIYQVTVNPDAAQGEIGPGETALDASKPGYASNAAGDAAAVRFNSLAGVMTYFTIYIAADPVPFKWKAISYENNQPGSTVYAEGTANPNKIGWNIVETHKAAIPANYLIAIYFLESGKPKIGLSSEGTIDSWWTYSASKNQWMAESSLPFMIRAFVQAADPVRITNNNAADTDPNGSPDRTRIAFTSNRGGNTDLWIMNADGSNPKQLTDGQGQNTQPAWSPDGKQIAFVSDRNGNPEIYSVQIDGTGLTRLTDDPGIDTDPAWSQTGDRLFFSSNRDSGMEIYSLLLGSNKVNRLTVSTGDAREPHGSMAWIGSEIARLTVEEENTMSAIPSSGRLLPSSLTARLIVSSGKANAGDPITIDVTLDGAENLGNLAFDLEYNPTYLSLRDIPLDRMIVNPLFALYPEYFPSSAGIVQFNGIYATGLNGTNSIMNLLFDIERDALADQTTIAVKNAKGYNIQYADIAIVGEDGVVTILHGNTDVQAWMLY